MYANIEDFSIPERSDLEDALGDLATPWDTGPYGERARQLLAEHAEGFEERPEHPFYSGQTIAITAL